MTIHEYGKEHPKHLLFFQGSCEPWEEFSEAARLLSVQFHVILVTPDGHDPEEHTDFISVEKTVDDTVTWLHTKGICHLDAVYGLSFGGGMVVHMLSTGKMTADKAIIDAGTAPYVYPRWICRLIGVRDYLMLKIGRSSVGLMELSFPPERFARNPENAREEYKEIQRYLKTYSNKTIWNIFWSANNYAVPKTAPVLPTKIQFWVGTDEWGSRFRDLKWAKAYLPQIEVVKIPGMMHGEYVLMHPREFAAQALAFLGGSVQAPVQHPDTKEGRGGELHRGQALRRGLIACEHCRNAVTEMEQIDLFYEELTKDYPKDRLQSWNRLRGQMPSWESLHEKYGN